MLIAGIDEAGRGPALGPLVMAITVGNKDCEDFLKEKGVRDSKLCSLKERDGHYITVRETVKEYSFIKISPQEIDELRKRNSLNEIEAMRAAQLINSLKNRPDVVYVDSPDPVSAKFGERILKYSSYRPNIISEHKADLNYPIVSAASIIAKVERDRAMEELAKEYGNIGCGYPSDPDTIRFLRDYAGKNKCLPSCARHSWITNMRLLDEAFQKKLFT